MGNVLKKYDVISETWQTVGGAVTGDTLPIGSMLPYGNANPPAGWLVCDGSAISRTTYADLFSVIGTNYGEGDSTTTFNLPNKKGRVSAGYDSTNSKFNVVGKKLGEETHRLTLAELPQNIYLPYGQSGTTGKAAISNNVVYTNSDYQGQTAITCGGNGDSHNNIQPTEVDNWIIKAFQSSGVIANVAKIKTNSDNDVYSCNYINEKTDGSVLYEDETGINTTVNLNESVANYKYIDIFFRDDNNIYDTKRFFVKNGAWYTLQITQFEEASSNVVIRGKNIQLNADKIYNGKYCAVVLNASGNMLYWNNNIYICKVIGYK